jgi:hypothetical protein
VNSGATLAGIGTVGPTTINSGGTFAPGNSPGTITVQGNLAFQSGAIYLVQVNPSTASSTNVTAGGSAALAGTVEAAFASGSYAARTYTILSAAGGLNGTTFNTLTTSNLPAGFTANLSYTATDAILNLTATLGQPSGPSGPGGPSGPSALSCGFSINQCNVANALNAFFNNGGTLPPTFVTIFGLTGANLANALSQLSGEAAAGAHRPSRHRCMSRAGRYGAQASEPATAPAAISPSSAATISPRAPRAAPPASIIASHPIPWWASRWRAPALTGIIGPTASLKARGHACLERARDQRPRDAGYGRQRSSARGQMQKLPSVGKFHFCAATSCAAVQSTAHLFRRW